MSRLLVDYWKRCEARTDPQPQPSRLLPCPSTRSAKALRLSTACGRLFQNWTSLPTNRVPPAASRDRLNFKTQCTCFYSKALLSRCRRDHTKPHFRRRQRNQTNRRHESGPHAARTHEHDEGIVDTFQCLKFGEHHPNIVVLISH